MSAHIRVGCYNCGNLTDDVKIKRVDGHDQLICLSCISQGGQHEIARTNATPNVQGLQTQDGGRTE